MRMLTPFVERGLMACLGVSALIGAVCFLLLRYRDKDQKFDDNEFGDLKFLFSLFIAGVCGSFLIAAFAIAVTIRGCVYGPEEMPIPPRAQRPIGAAIHSIQLR